ncbi:MAG TPA: DUF4124 domain-containing protein [Verrucomicrobiae bacterium]|nr:DUF4124 domain-containing protein [Verrucomicrobiae bacterium]
MRFTLAALFFLLPALALAQVYRWTDAQGRIHYSQVPPPGGTAQTLAPPPAAGPAPNQESLNKSLQDAIKAEPKVREEAARIAGEQAQRQAQCQQARDNIAYMDQQTPRRMMEADAQGNVSRVTTEQFAQRRAELEAIAATHCG